MLFVGNGMYGLSLNEIAEREGLRDGLLDVRVLRAEAFWPSSVRRSYC